MCYVSLFEALVVFCCALTHLSSARILDNENYRGQLETWGTAELGQTSVGEPSSNKIGFEETSGNVLSSSGKNKIRVSSSPIFLEPDERSLDNRPRPTVDRSLTTPMRKPTGGPIAFPPVLPLIHGRIRNLPFGTTFVTERKSLRRKFGGAERRCQPHLQGTPNCRS
ncbi:hypothetical protein Y032_0144g2450 [Ancylostoma ceylanicum]|uniref:Uncharacterized protein n=1 Tax=Ancylostoma ceylanicum TaxID=53326 RepID=A0A016T1W9_9BILA|nr:hypothetical protein Y032_0144g2450 [Ancylostoma ceylanicum]